MANVDEAGRTVLEDTVVPARAPWSARIAKGDVLRFVDLEGQQAIDFICYNAEDYTERYNQHLKTSADTIWQ